MVKLKGVDLFLETAFRLYKLNKEYEFILVGEGPEKEKCEKIARKNKSNVKFLGWHTNTQNIFPIFDILLFTSRWESFGLVLVEAMASGIPICGFDIPGANEIMKNHTTGVLVKPFNVKELSEVTHDLLRRNDLRMLCSFNCRKRAVKYFSIEKNSNQIEDIYKDQIK